MKLLVFITSVLAATSNALAIPDPTFASLVSEDTYDEALSALVTGEVDQSDGSKGTVWFDTSSYELELSGFPLIGLYGITTETSYNYLDKLSGLGELALDRGNHGDFVYIMYRFLYYESLKGASDPHSLLIGEMTKGLSPSFNNNVGSEELTEILALSSTLEQIENIYNEVGSAEAALLTSLSLELSARRVYTS